MTVHLLHCTSERCIADEISALSCLDGAPCQEFSRALVNISGAVMSSACLCGEDPLALMLRPRELFAPITVSRSIGR
jgi:hypothetical protein